MVTTFGDFVFWSIKENKT